MSQTSADPTRSSNQPPRSVLALASFLLSLLGFFPFLAFYFSIPAVFFGFLALWRISAKKLRGEKLAFAGIILGGIGFLISLKLYFLVRSLVD